MSFVIKVTLVTEVTKEWAHDVPVFPSLFAALATNCFYICIYVDITWDKKEKVAESDMHA